MYSNKGPVVVTAAGAFSADTVRHCCIEIDVLVVSGITRVHKMGIASLWDKARRIGERKRAAAAGWRL
jgi:hypothetical protein